MSAAELDQKALAVLQGVAGEDHLSVILGAGASMSAGLPDWNTLAVELLVSSGAVTDRSTAEAFLTKQDPALAAEAARAMVGADAWKDLVTTALYRHTPATRPLDPTPLHEAVAELATRRPPHEIGLFTLNFDVLLETALERELADAGVGEVFTRYSLAPGPHGHYIVNHLHGVVDDTTGTCEGVVLTLKDFTTLAGRSGSWQFSDLQRELASGPMLLAGTSYRDPDLRQWLHEATSATDAPQHPRVVFLARQGLDLDRGQFARVQDALVEQWTSIGITPVLTHDHSDAAQAMRELSALGQQGYLAPQQRTEALLAAHQERFDDLQREYAQQLNDDLEVLRPHLGQSANLTLWLADGQGSVIRWASNDRIYRSPADLRSVPSGYDSPWIAGQCLSREEVIAAELSHDGSIRRWRSVVAAPIALELPGGPRFSAAAISSATPAPLAGTALDAWFADLRAIAEAWSTRLTQAAPVVR